MYPDYARTPAGFSRFIKSFSWPGGFPSHVNAETPCVLRLVTRLAHICSGQIHEGGELGYALSVSYGSVMDMCVVDHRARLIDSGPT